MFVERRLFGGGRACGWGKREGCRGFWLESCVGILDEIEKELGWFVESVYFLLGAV